MNYSAIPNFIAIGLVVILSFPLLRFSNQFRLRYWFAGWLVVLFHAALMIVDSTSGYAARSTLQHWEDAGTDSSLALAGVLFICATGMPRRTRFYLPFLAVLPNFVAMICWDVQVVSHPIYYLLMAAGAATAIWGVLHGVFPYHGSRSTATVAIGAAYLLQAFLLWSVSLDNSAAWLLCWPFLVVAYLFVNNSTKITVGVVITSVSFVLWGLVFPLAWLLTSYFPTVTIEMQVWNIPKFLAISAMILVLLEQQLDKMKVLAMHDSLTELPNRRAYVERFEEACRRAKRSGTKIALLAIDLDDFKPINDFLGHNAGDELLRSVASRLRQSIRSTDMLARIGGDEFAVILEAPPNREAVSKLSRVLQDSLREPVALAGHLVAARASIGVAIYPDDARDFTGLLAVADREMYQSKAAGKKHLRPSSVWKRNSARLNLHIENVPSFVEEDDGSR